MDLTLPFWNLTDDTNFTLPPLPENGNSTTNDELFQGYSSALLMFASVSCVIFILIGIPGNLITIIALAKCKKVRNATAVFIINLSLSDLLFCCFNLPLAASTFWRNTWPHGELLCRLFPLMRYGLLAVSLFTVLAITINRYVMIGHPRIYPRIYRRRYLAIMVASTWFSAFGILIPTWKGAWGTFGLDRSIGSCTILRDENGTSPKEFLFIMAFIIPCISIIACYARIFYIVRKTAMRSHEPFQASVRMMNKSQRMNTQDGNQSDRQLFSKSSKTSKDENSENSSSISNSSGYPVPIISQKNSMRSKSGADIQQDVHEDEIKFIDSKSIPDHHRTLSILKKIRKETTPLNSLSSFKENSLKEPGTLSTLSDVDSAVEDSMSSVDNNQVYHITSSTDISNQLLSVQVEPSSSSGLDLPLEQEHYQRRKVFRKIFKSSLTKISRRSGYKPSTMNSGASILYPGRMTQKDRRLLKMILVIFLSFLVCYLPITITKIWKGVTKIHVFNIMGYILIYLTTCINPIIYVVMSSEYRQAYWNLLLCRTLAAQSSNIPIRAKSKETRPRVKSFRD